MDFFEKWKLTQTEWNYIITFPYYISYIVSVSSADEISFTNEKYNPYFEMINALSLSDDDIALVDIAKNIVDYEERSWDISETYHDMLVDKDLLDDEGFFNKKAIIVDHYLPLLNLFDEINKEKIIEFCVYLAWETAAYGNKTAVYYGQATNPIHEKEKIEFDNICKWLDVNPDTYYEGNKREIYLNYLNLLEE